MENNYLKHINLSEKKNQYDKYGFCILKKVFTDDEADNLNKYLRRHATKDFAAIINPDRYETLYEQDERFKSDITCEEIEETSNYARSILTDKRMKTILDEIHGSNCIALSSQFIFKEAKSPYANQAWRPHQDNFYPKNKNAAYVTLNWFLRKADVENGTIYCYPGTHKLGLLPAENNVSFREKIGNNPGSECKIPSEFLNKKQDMIIPANSIVILHGNCIHGSYPNLSERSRPWFSGCYMTEGEDFIEGKNSKRKIIKLKD
tara:strand:- start:5346 stop:6131 length:786 start_codon:yes stop_codon:yes gene_type:complete